MKKILMILGMIAAAGIFSQLNAQSQEEMKKWMDYMTPSDIHKEMAKWDGEWTEDIQTWMAPGAPPQSMQASCVNKMVMGGRYQEGKHTGNFMGMPFEGFSTTGYDNARKILVSSWVDNMGTGMMIGEGPWDEKTQTVTIKGTMMDPMTGKPCNFREIFKVVDNEHQVLEMYAPDPATGKEFKTMEIRYTRNK